MKFDRLVLLPAILLWGWTAQAQLVQYSSDASGNLIQRSAGTNAPPQIIKPPQQQVVIPGDFASFSILLADSGGCVYQWRFFGTNLPGQTADSLVVSGVTTNNQGPYSVVVANNSGSVTSSVAQLYIDTRGCGMPDSWQLTYFGNLNQNASGDVDGDGISNLQEFLDGTNPTNNASFLSRLTVLTDGGGTVTVAPEQPSYAPTNTVILTAAPFPPNTFFSWTGDLAARTNPAALIMNTNKTVSAHFMCDAPPYGMAGWWRGENDASDALGVNPGSLSNGVSFAAGQVGQGFQFTGTNQEVRVPASPTLNVGAGNGLTLEAWVKPGDLVNQYPLFEWSDGLTLGVHFWINVAFSGQGGPGCIYANLRDVNLADHYFFSPTGLLNTSAWSHVALTYDKTSGNARLFFNGLTVASVNLGSFVPLTTTNLNLGYRPGSVSYSGLLDELSVYNRALTPAEVLSIYVADAAGKCWTLPYITSSAQFPDAVAGTGYTQQVTSVFGTLPVTFSLSAGTLPPGLSLSSAGLLSGVPTTAGSNVFGLLASDAAGLSRELVSGLNVRPAPVSTSPPGLLAWWRAENNALDSIGGHNGTLSNGVSYAAGELGQAFSFDGTNSYVVSPDIGFPSGNAPRTVEFWMKYAAGASGNHEPFFYGTQAVGSSFYVIVIGNRLYIGQYGGGDTPGSTIVTDGNWHHVALAYDGFIASMYVDGQLDASSPRAYSTALSGSFLMGALPGTSDRFKGQVDELAVYGRALSASEIGALYQAGSLGKKSSGPYFNTPSPLPDGIVGQGYAQGINTLFAALPVAYSVLSGSLPPGLSLSSQGTLSGTPTNAGVYNFLVSAVDSASASNIAPYSLTVYPLMPPPPGLVSWWRGETNALDSAGTNNGVLRNGATFAPGKVGQAFSLDGISQSVDIPDAPSLRPASVTLETWALFTASGTRILLGKPVGPGTLDSYQIYISAGTLGAFVSDAAGAGPVLSIPFSPIFGNWYHFAYTFDDAGKQEALYVNGSQVASGVANKTIAYDSQPVLLGRDIENGSPSFFFAGRLDEASIYNRALGSNEIASLYQAGPAGKTTLGPAFATPPVLPVAVAGQPYSQTLTLARGTSQSFAVVGGALPPGLGLNSGGQISGTPMATGAFAFTVRATDSTSVTADQPFTLQVLPKVVPPAGIVGWWRAENNTLDSIGGNNGFLINAATFAPGKAGQAFSLNGVSDAVEIEDAPALRPASVTLETWVMFFSANGVQSIMGKTVGSGSANSYQIWLENGYLKGTIADITGASNPISVLFSPNVGQWYHVALTFDDTTKQQILYLNGVAVAFGVSNLSIGYDTHPLFLGADDNGTMTLFLQGRIDEVALYNRALSAAEIASIYSADAAGKTAVGPYISTPPALPDAAYGIAYTQSISSVRGTPNVTYALTGGGLPAGLALSPQGLLSGVPTNLSGVMPTNAATFSFSVRATDGAGLFADQLFSLRVAAPIPPPAGLVSWWRAESNALDSIGTNHGAALNGTAYAPGQVGQAFSLDGINDCILIPDSPGLRPPSLTIECWALFNANTGIQVIFAKPLGGGTLDSFALWLQNGTLYGAVSDNSGFAPALSIPFSPVVEQWYHLAFTFDWLTRQQVLYLNNITVASGSADRSIAYDANPLLLGCDRDNGSRAWFVQGRIDEAAIYNRALTAKEIASLYYAGAAGKTTIGPYFTTLPPLPDAVINQPYSQTLSSTRGTPPVAYSLSSGTPPPGLTFSATGVLSGTPANSGRFAFNARATDATGRLADQAYTLNVFAPALAPNGLFAWWRAENNALDSAGTNNGTLLNGATFSAGKVGTAFSLNGTNAGVAISNSAWMNPAGAFSVETWINADAQQFSPDGNWLIVDKSHGWTDGTGWALQGNPDGTVSFLFGLGGSSSAANFLFVTSPGSLRDNHWHHLAGVFTGAQLLLYEDGILQSALTTTNFPVANTRDVEIGRSWGGGSPTRYFHGLIDEVSIYNRALSAADIAAIFNAGPAGKVLSLPSIILKASLQNGALVLSFAATPGKTYTIQYRDSLSSGTWQSATNIVASSALVSYTNSVATPQQRFFRVSATGN